MEKSTKNDDALLADLKRGMRRWCELGIMSLMLEAVSKTWPHVHFVPLSKKNDYSVIPDHVLLNKISLERGDVWL